MIARALTAIRTAWCAAIHDAPTIPLNGTYGCRHCPGVRFPVRWEPRQQQPADARAVEAQSA